jgi:hypothetical protein
MGLTPCCSWDEGWIRVLNLLGVPRKAILSISAEDVYDTQSKGLPFINCLVLTFVSV